MTLAKELLEKDERAVVLEYFDLCVKFWEFDREGKLRKWKSRVEAGKTPDFGAEFDLLNFR